MGHGCDMDGHGWCLGVASGRWRSERSSHFARLIALDGFCFSSLNIEYDGNKESLCYRLLFRQAFFFYLN